MKIQFYNTFNIILNNTSLKVVNNTLKYKKDALKRLEA